MQALSHVYVGMQGSFCHKRKISSTRDEISSLPLGRIRVMAKAPVSLTSLSEEQRAEASARFEILRPALEEGVSQAQIARTHQLSKSAVQRWVARYREQGLAGLATTARKDKGKSRRLPEQAITLVEGLALQTPPRSAAAIHRQVV